MLLHGDEDTDVPYAQSAAMAERLGTAGVRHELISMAGRGHDFEQPGFADPVVAKVLDRVLAFLRQHV